MSFTTTSFTINYSPHIVGDYIVPELLTDFSDDFDNMMLQYIYDQWSLSTPTELQKPADKKAQNTFLQFKIGQFDFSRPYEIAAIKTDTRVHQVLMMGRSLILSTGVDIGIRMRDINRDKLNPAFQKMETEIMRIISQYANNEIIGIKEISFEGQEPITNATDTFMKSDWRSVTHVRMHYEKRNIQQT